MPRMRSAHLLITVTAALLALSACQHLSQHNTRPDDSLSNTYWKLMALEGQPVSMGDGQREPYIVLVDGSQRVRGFAGCNRIQGRYVHENDTLRLKNIVSTRMSCADGMRTEQALLQVLGRSMKIRIEGNTLFLMDTSDRTLARFESRLMQ